MNPNKKPSIFIVFDRSIIGSITNSDIDVRIEGIERGRYNYTVGEYDEY